MSTLNKLSDILSQKLAQVLSILLLSVCTGGVGMINANAAEANGKAFIEIGQKIDGVSAEVTTLGERVGLIEVQMLAGYEVINSMRLDLFRDKLANLEKQSYKLQKDPTDLKPIDMLSASDFCASMLFTDFIDTLSGSDKVVVNQSCADVNEWVIYNS